MNSNRNRIGIIGGTGVYDIPGVEVKEEIALQTPWGATSRSLLLCEASGKEVVFLARHGKGHCLLAHEVNYRANIAAMKHLGVEEIMAFSAVGSLREELEPLHFVLPDQLIDRTRSRSSTFFGSGVAGHIGFADPYCMRFQAVINGAAQELGLPVHMGETLVCIEGPAFSTRAESKLYRSWGAGVINMSALPEARLAREAGICYSLVCMVTDYDCWRTGGEDVEIGDVFENLKKNAEKAKLLTGKVIEGSGQARECSCGTAWRSAVITQPENRDPKQEERLRFIFEDL